MYHGERFNAWTHLVGALLALTGATWLIVTTSLRADAQAITSVSIYGAALVLLYAISTVYHSVRGRAKRIWQKCDHLSIYLMIAGSYTPFRLISLRGAWGWSLFGVVWGLALIGHAARDQTAQRGARAVFGDLCRHGLGRAGGHRPAAGRLGHRRLCLAGRWRSAATAWALCFLCWMRACATFTASGTCL